VALGVDADRDQRVHVDHTYAFADLEHQRIGSGERVRASVQWAGAEPLDGGVGLAITQTCDFDNDVMPRLSTSLFIRRVDNPSR
jgi:hypothetical protein